MGTIFLAVTGTQGSGKSVFTDIAKRKYKIPTYRLGNIIFDECKKRGLEINGRNIAKMAAALRYEEGDQAIAGKAIPAIKELIQNNPKMLLIDGIRSFSELALLRAEFGEIKLVAIISSLKVRKERVEARKRIDHESEGDFQEREQRELGFGLGDAITKADHYILNDGISKSEFISKIEELLERIMDNK
ncbi:MAG: AAA family ATPase [Candidatus Heimdallarchaeota archaeon]|nr:AAA family ATPase [Candidatus Heimdallarchaeota archaeon]